jgi:Spy/CpxP family protein refolding chaperone
MIKMILPTLAAAAVLCAQGPQPGARMRGDRQPQMNEIKAYLNLTDAQLQSFQQLHRERMQAVQPLVREMMQKQQALRDLEKGSADPTAVGNAVLELKDLRKRVSDGSAQFHDRALNVLNPDQRAKLKALEDAAKLRPTIAQAGMLQLLDRSAIGGDHAGMRFGEGRMFRNRAPGARVQ